MAIKLPNDIEAEQAVIGSVMLDSNGINFAIEILPHEKFFHNSYNKEIWKSIVELAKNDTPCDILNVTSLLKDHKTFEKIGGAKYLTSLLNVMPTTGNIQSYSNIVKEKYYLRRYALAGKTIYDSIISGKETTNEKVEELIGLTLLNTLEEKSENIVHVKDGLEEIYSQILKKEEPALVKTGLENVDNIILGFNKTDLIILAARPGMGKSAFAMQVALNNLRRKPDKKVLFFSLEMSTEQIQNRMISNLAMIDHSQLRSRKYGDDIISKSLLAINQIRDMNLYIDPSPNPSVYEIKSKLHIANREKNIGLVIIDYLQLMQNTDSKENRNLELANITRSLKNIAKKFNTPILLLSQLSRECEKRGDKRPLLSDLRDSGAIEQDADLVMFIYRDAYYTKKKNDKTSEIIISKNRHGETGMAKAVFRGEMLRFDDMAGYLG